ncbi:hypothetical protein L7F22_068562 [Adiantum nelumboides]|nr:hypothetical protein [Adiantum nelumboides]
MEHEGAYLDLTILSAADLKRAWLSGDQTVAIAWIDPSLKKSTGVTSGEGCNALWHEKLTIPLKDTDTIARDGKWLTIEIRSQGAFGFDNLLGTANVPFAELALDTQKEANSTQTYQLVLPSGKRYGSVSFVGKIVKPRATSNYSATLPSAPPASMLNGYQSNVLYPPASYSSNETYTEKPSFMHSTYPPAVSPWHDSTTGKIDDPYHGKSSLQIPYGVASHPTQIYPPVNASCQPSNPPASCAPSLCAEGVAPYPPSFWTAPYPPTSMYQHHTPPVPYPPKFVYPPVPYHMETPYSPSRLYTYPIQSSALYPPPYPPQQAPPMANYCGPHAAF